MNKKLMMKVWPELLEGWCGPVKCEDANGELNDCVVLGLHVNKIGVWAVPLDPSEFEDVNLDEDVELPMLVSLEYVYFDMTRGECKDRAARWMRFKGHDLQTLMPHLDDGYGFEDLKPEALLECVRRVHEDRL